ncbi:MAG: hypothetical protein QOF01_2425 [Thermomicrobiales bacterium]|nr:hypothetical protein [Thermomicrobiales bacterium]
MRLGILTDAHLCPPGTPPDGCHNPYAFDRAEALLAQALSAHRADGVDGLAVLGDLANGGDEPSMQRAFDLLAGARLPTWLVPGNHDRDEDPARLAALVRRGGPGIRLGHPAGEVVGGIRLAGLPITGHVSGGEWLVEAASIAGWGSDPVVLLSHFPVLPREAAVRGAGLRYVGSFEDRDGIAAGLLGRASPTVVVHGHLHLRDAVADGAVLQIGCAALIEPPHERAIVAIDLGRDEPRVRVTHLPVTASPPVRLPVLSPRNGEWVFRSGSWVEVPTDV